MVKQGDIIKINLNPKQGYAQQGYKPYVYLSYKGIIHYSNIAIFAPISNTQHDYPLYVSLYEKANKTTGKVLLDQLVTIDFNARDYNYVETLSEDFINELLAKVKINFQKD